MNLKFPYIYIKLSSVRSLVKSFYRFYKFCLLNIIIFVHKHNWNSYNDIVINNVFPLKVCFINKRLFFVVQLNEGIGEINHIEYEKGDRIQIPRDFINDVNFKILFLLVQQACTDLASRGLDLVKAFLDTTIGLPAISQVMAARVEATLQVTITWSIRSWRWGVLIQAVVTDGSSLSSFTAPLVITFLHLKPIVAVSSHTRHWRKLCSSRAVVLRNCRSLPWIQEYSERYWIQWNISKTETKIIKLKVKKRFRTEKGILNNFSFYEF